mgnify:CR=1 FL=1
MSISSSTITTLKPLEVNVENLDINAIHNNQVKTAVKMLDFTSNTKEIAKVVFDILELNNVQPYRVRINDSTQDNAIYLTSGGKSKEGFLVVRIGNRVNYYANYSRNGGTRTYDYLVQKQRKLNNGKRITTVITQQ